jgi:hypothetical protein
VSVARGRARASGLACERAGGARRDTERRASAPTPNAQVLVEALDVVVARDEDDLDLVLLGLVLVADAQQRRELAARPAPVRAEVQSDEALAGERRRRRHARDLAVAVHHELGAEDRLHS